MNIQNYQPFNPSWAEIFHKQRELKFLYEPEAKELFENFDIDCFEDQELFKKYCWRITEELVEAEEAYIKHDGRDHIEEELIDALNFSIELALLYGWDPAEILKDSATIRRNLPYFGEEGLLAEVAEIIYTLGLSANRLKNRQWRRSQYLVDLLVFEKDLKTFFFTEYYMLWRYFGSGEKIRQAWSLKYQVNLFRIQTNY